jgi:TPR repeat protein
MGKKSKRKTKTKPPVVVDDVRITADEVLFKHPPPKDDCPICFLPMPTKLICCASLTDATVMSVPIYDLADANEESAKVVMEEYYSCCGKSICKGCVYSFIMSDNQETCPFCNSNRASKTDEDKVKELMKRVEVDDPASICVLARFYCYGLRGLQQDRAKAIELYAKAANLGDKEAHYNLAGVYHEGGDLKKAKFHFEASAMAGHEDARYNLGGMEFVSGNMDQALKHWTIAASAGEHGAMHHLITFFKKGVINRKSIDSTLTAYNNSCKEMRSEARDAYIHVIITDTI